MSKANSPGLQPAAPPPGRGQQVPVYAAITGVPRLRSASLVSEWSVEQSLAHDGAVALTLSDPSGREYAFFLSAADVADLAEVLARSQPGRPVPGVPDPC